MFAAQATAITTGPNITDLGLQLSFPKGCQISKGNSAYIALCAQLFGKHHQKPLPALLPIFMISSEPHLNPNKKEHDPISVKRDAARLVCGSEQELEQMQFKDFHSDTNSEGKSHRFIVICPADSYGVIGERIGYYLQIITKNNRYHAVGRFLLSQSKKLSPVAQSFINSVKLSPKTETIDK
ncbi:MAG: hypothetical protein ACRBBJ_04195 [Rhodomicrobiaceae bacterium]